PEFSIRTSPFITSVSMAFLFFVVLSTVDTLPRLRWTLLAAVASMGWASLFVVREWMRDPMWRPGSIAGDANYFALDTCLIVPLAFLFVWRSRVLWERVFALACLLATLGASMLGGSRGGFIALAVAFLWLVWHSPRRLRNLTVIVLLLAPPLLFFPFSPVRRMLHPKQSDLNGENARRVAWEAGLRMVERHPILGIGLGEFKPQMVKYNDPGDTFASIAHNSYLEIAAESGVPALLVFITMLFFTYRTLGRVRRLASDSGPPLLYLAATGIQAGFFGFFLGAFFLSAEYLKLFWLFVFLSMVLPSFLPVRVAGRPKKKEYVAKPMEEVPEGVGW
ncbi:MAG: O-antigen ligase family protein, partial [Candidatus Acidiferrales bacterium]